MYAEAGLEAASIQVVKARWMLFGHTLRLHENTPARLAMLSYFNNANDDKIRLGRPAVTIATCLSNEYMKCTGDEINNIDSDNEEKTSVHNSDSEHEFMDLEVECVCNNNTLVVKKN